MVTQPSDEYYMRQAIRLARKGMGRTNPNPMVGAVIVCNDQIIGRGYHKRYGDKHAEVNAIEDAGGKVAGTTIYITLEPCCHQDKRTPPCVDAIIRVGIRKVVIGALDPNPQVNGKGVQRLRSQGIEVKIGVLEEECGRLNEVYFKYIRTGIPFVTVKYAQTLDGRIASRTGQSQWISSPATRKHAHWLRSISDGLMVGIGTVLADDPSLTVRLVRGKNPVPIIVDSFLRIPLEAKVLKSQSELRPIVAATAKADADKVSALRGLGVEVLILGEDGKGGVNLVELLGKLGERKLSSVLVEGGSEIITSLLKERLVDKLAVCIAPKILGEGIEAVRDLGIMNIDDAIRLSNTSVRKMGDDYLLEGGLSHL